MAENKRVQKRWVRRQRKQAAAATGGGGSDTSFLFESVDLGNEKKRADWQLGKGNASGKRDGGLKNQLAVQ